MPCVLLRLGVGDWWNLHPRSPQEADIPRHQEGDIIIYIYIIYLYLPKARVLNG